MNIIVVHGDHSERSAQRVGKFIDTAYGRGWEVVRFDPSNPKSLRQVLTEESLFQKERLFILERPTLLTKKELAWLKRVGQNIKGNLVIYHRELLDKDFLDSLPRRIKIEEFRLSESIFDFLNSFYPGNSRNCSKIFHSLLKKEPVEFVFALLAKHLRDLYLAKVDPEKLWYQPWRVQKLKKQALLFDIEKLKEIISLLAKADIDAKTSQISLVDSLDLLIATKLE